VKRGFDMFTIDLLKGQGIPVKSEPTSMAIASATVAVPVIFALFIFGSFLTNKIKISIKQDEIKSLQTKINSTPLEDAVKNQNLIEQKRQNLRSSLVEVSMSISKHTQWSPVLESVIKNMPRNMVLRAADIKEEKRKGKKLKDDDPEKTVDTVALIRVLNLSLIGGFGGNYDDEVRAFRDALLSDSSLADKLEDIRVAQETTKINDKEVISYIISLVFKPVV
jgi:Tfp pilus assembly protein PilN